MDYTKIYQADIAALIGPDDQVFAVVPYRLAHGAERVERDADVIERRLRPLPRGLRRRAQDLGSRERRADGAGNRSLLDRILDIDWPWNKIDWDEKFAGTSVAGRPGSLAVRLADGTRHGVALFGVVTARRFVIVRRIATDRFTLVAEAPRAEVVEARRRSRPFQRGRVVIGFADSSQLAVHTGILLSGQAKRLVAALSPTPPSEM
ncbi:MAG TPA: hypothetical protein VFU43_07885 [Streptosporangiaceae bacterium]|nr:hypothetical protein [Streptosporangiaceae bacterium]